LSKWKNYSRSHSINTKGTPTHISPEQWKDDSFCANYKSDVYSFSILLWEMFTEKVAYEGRHGELFVVNQLGLYCSFQNLFHFLSYVGIVQKYYSKIVQICISLVNFQELSKKYPLLVYFHLDYCSNDRSIL